MEPPRGSPRRGCRTVWFGRVFPNQMVWQVTLVCMRASGEATRQRILEAAKREFAQYGLSGARINRIAANAHASKERLYAYFPSKEALFAAVAELLVSDVT